MSKEVFNILKEINSLQERVIQTQSLITKQNARISTISEKRERRHSLKQTQNEQIKELSSDITQTENLLSELYKKIEQNKISLNNVQSESQLKSVESNIEQLSAEAKGLDELCFEKMIQKDDLQMQVEEAQTFLDGSKESLEEIESEVKEENQAHNIVLSGLKERISVLKEQLPPIAKSKIEVIFSQNIAKTNFSRIEKGHCEMCRFALTQVAIREVEDQLKLKSCSSCGRIFLPVQSFY